MIENWFYGDLTFSPSDPAVLFLSGFILATLLDLRGWARWLAWRLGRSVRRFFVFRGFWLFRLLFGGF